MFGCLLIAMITNRSLLGPFMLFNPVTDVDVETTTYQGAGRSVLITSVVAAGFASSQGRQLGIMIAAVIALLSLGSRTYLVTGATCMLLMLFMSALRRKQRLGLVVSFGVVVAISYVALPILLVTRAGELFDLGGSSSWQMRGTLQQTAVAAIRSNPLLGDFAYHIREISLGGYSHNALSAWTEFGLIGFILYCSLLLFFLVTALRHVFSPNPLWQAAVGLNISALFIVNAEPVFSLLPPLAWGVVINAMLQERRERERLRQLVPVAGSA
jgi:O-antigen ligase